MTKSKKDTVVFIVEGEKLDVQIMQEICTHFIPSIKKGILVHGTHIYSLYNQLKKDDFATDIIELLKEKSDEEELNNLNSEDVSEIYLFFDFDGHNYQDRSDGENIALSEIEEMLQCFNNETESGKLYLSYPMIESIFHLDKTDFDKGTALTLKTFYAFSGRDKAGKHYKKISGVIDSYYKKTKNSLYSEADWNFILHYFLCCLMNLFEQQEFIEYKVYRQMISPEAVFEQQKDKYIMKAKKILVLNGYPQFIIDYFGNALYEKLILQLGDYPADVKIIDIE